MEIAKFEKKPFLGILRGIDTGVLEPLLDTVISSGLETIEVTMNTANASELIRRAVEISKGRLVIGAGTVLGVDSLKQALDAGATFIVSPVLIKEVVEHCVKNKIPVFPGALTPQEIYNAWQAGATMVKVFPAKLFGPSYFREVKAPLGETKLLACGGVNKDNIKEYFSNGADAIAFGASVFKKEWLIKKDFVKIAQSIKLLIK